MSKEKIKDIDSVIAGCQANIERIKEKRKVLDAKENDNKAKIAKLTAERAALVKEDK
jgi:hypothetical protein